eukprot:COSAG01_NODE_33066_length_570_cov_2.420382_1_plen_146_part_00
MEEKNGFLKFQKNRYWQSQDIMRFTYVAPFLVKKYRDAAAAQARRIIAVDVNTTKFPLARAMGATDCVDPADARHEGRPVQEVLVGMTEWGLDYTFDCTGNVTVMRAALEAAHRGWGVSCVIGVAAAVRPLRPFLAICAQWEVTC